MNISPDSFITPDQILADVLTETEDYDFREFTKGWYISQMQQCLEKLSFNTFMKTIDDDFAFPSDTNSMTLPANTFNLKAIFVYNGTIGNPTDSEIVNWKRGASRKNTNAFFANNKASHNEDPYYAFATLSDGNEAVQLWAAIDNGVITFSDQCATYEFVHLRYNGTLTAIGETPFVPQFFRQTVKLFCALEYYRRMRKRHPRTFRVLFQDTYNELYAPFTGEWAQALKLSKSMDSKARKDMNEYLSKMNY